jgi:hypothetical protein
MPFDLHRVLSDKQMLMARKPHHEVTRCHAGKARIGMNAHNARIKMTPRLGIPTRMKRRVERQAMMGYFDARDFDAHGTQAFIRKQSKSS